MRRSLVFFVMLLAVVVSGCTWGKIDAGYVGVVVPLTGDAKGTLATTTNGWYFYSFNTQVFEFPTSNQVHNWRNESGPRGARERIYFMDNTGQRVGADVGIQFKVPTDQVTKLFVTFRRPLDDIRDSILKMEVQNALNSAAQAYAAEDLLGNKRSAFFADALQAVQDSVGRHGIVVEQLYLNGELELPKAIVETITAKLQATMLAQQKENEKKAVEAEAAKVIAAAKGEAEAREIRARGEAEALLIKARAEAAANKEVAASLTGSILDLRKLEIQADVQKTIAGRWGGGVPTTVLSDQAGGLLMDLRGVATAATR